MNLSTLNFFRNLGSENKQFAVIGLGRFGSAVCSTFHSMNHEVLAVDQDEDKVNKVLSARIASHAIRVDTTDPSALREAGLLEFDTAIVAIGNYLDQSITTALNLKEGGVKHVVAKASSEIHMKLLQKVGADHVVFPEWEMGCALAKSLIQPNILDRFDLDPKHSIVESIVPEKFVGKTLAELDLRQRYGLTVLAISYDSNFVVNPPPQYRLASGSMFVIIGSNKDINRLPM